MMNDVASVEIQTRLQYKTYNGRADWREGLAKAYGAEHGYFGAQGGWIYRVRKDSSSAPNIQGWLAFYVRKRTQILDWLTQRLTAAPSFFNLVQAEGHYRPTILVHKHSRDGWMYEALAEAYDDAQRQRGDKRRAHRGRGYYRFGKLNGYLMPTHLVNGEHEAENKGICGMPIEGRLMDLTPDCVDLVTCATCRRAVNLG